MFARGFAAGGARVSRRAARAIQLCEEEGGFRNDILDTGWIHSTDSTLLGNISSSIVGTGQVVHQVDDVDPFDNFFDFTRGISSSLINVGQGPTVQPPAGGPPSVPAPSGLVLLGAGLIGLVAWRRSRARA